MTVEPGKSYRQLLFLDSWYEFDAPGRYEISVRLEQPPQGQDGNIITAPAETRLAFEIEPRDVGRLEAACADLLEQISLCRADYARAAEAATALSYVKDPVAVPYLERAISVNPMMDDIAIKGQERIGDESAVRALAAIMSDPADRSDWPSKRGTPFMLSAAAPPTRNSKKRSGAPSKSRDKSRKIKIVLQSVAV